MLTGSICLASPASRTHTLCCHSDAVISVPRTPIATETILKHETLVSLPLQHALWAGTALDSAPPLLTKLAEIVGRGKGRELLAMYVLSQRFNQTSPFYKYLRLLPQKCSNAYTISPDVFKLLKHTKLKAQAQHMRDGVAASFRQLFEHAEARQLFSKHCSMPVLGGVPDCWLWATCVVSSRSFAMDLSHMGSSQSQGAASSLLCLFVPLSLRSSASSSSYVCLCLSSWN